MLRDKPKPEDRNSLRTPFPLNLEPTRIPFCQQNGKQIHYRFVDVFTQYIDTK